MEDLRYVKPEILRSELCDAAMRIIPTSEVVNGYSICENLGLRHSALAGGLYSLQSWEFQPMGRRITIRPYRFYKYLP
jgi:hypothetical protein